MDGGGGVIDRGGSFDPCKIAGVSLSVPVIFKHVFG